MAKISILEIEKKRDHVTPDGVVKEGPEETAHGWPCLISLKRSSPWEEKESQKDSPGLKEKSEEIAASEQNTSKGKDRSLPCSNKKRKRKTWITELAAKVCILNAYEPKNKWMYLLIMFGMLLSGANGKGVDPKLKPYRYVSIATDETIAATDPVPQAQSYLIFASGGNHRRSYECTSDFVENNQTCNIVVGDKNKTECGGLRIFENETHTHLAVDGSKLTHDHTRFCIYQQAPGNFSLYFLDVYKNENINDCASYPCQNGGACLDGLDSYTCNCAKGYDGANCEIDNENPTISGCPSDQSVNTDRCDATAVVTWTPPTATDNSGTQTLTSTNNPGDSFPIGNNTVTYTSRDAAGNTDTCTFLITVADINECASNPCQNGGACVDELDSYTCNCAKGYDGANCEIGSNSTYWKNAFIGVAVVAVLAIIVILTLVYFLCCRKKSTKRVRDKSAKRVRDEDIEMGRL